MQTEFVLHKKLRIFKFFFFNFNFVFPKYVLLDLGFPTAPNLLNVGKVIMVQDISAINKKSYFKSNSDIPKNLLQFPGFFSTFLKHIGQNYICLWLLIKTT